MNVRQLDYRKIKITHQGFAAVVRHISRFEYDEWNYLMLIRLLHIITGQKQATDWDKRFYSHELREYAWYRHAGWEKGEPDDSHAFWRQHHYQSLSEYMIEH